MGGASAGFLDMILSSRCLIEEERKPVALLYADLAGYNSVVEKLDPVKVYQIMDRCSTILTDEASKRFQCSRI
jgi:class 3 adenylate cyclase